MKLSNKQSVPILVLILLGLSMLLYCNTINLFPAFIHSWTQSERYALSLGFLNNGFDFFHPCTFNLQTINGITRVDFPINEYIVAILMKLSGSTSPAIFRIYTLSISITGLVYLYLLAKKITSSDLKSLLVVLFVFLSPVYVYYQAGFIPSVPAIAFVFIAYYYFFSYKEDNNKKHFYLSILFFLLAALIRIPFLIFLIGALTHQLWTMFKNKKINRFEISVFIFSFILFGMYYRYNVHLGRMYGNAFLDSFLPAKSMEEFKEILAQMYHVWKFQYFTKMHYYLLLFTAFITVISLFFRKEFFQRDKDHWFQLLLISCGTGLYFLLMSRQYYDHDYYFLDSLFVPVVLFFIFSIKNLKIERKIAKFFSIICTLIIVYSFYTDAKDNQAERYTTYAWDRVEATRQNFIGTEKYLDSIGISKDAKILVIEAYSTNIPLILMNRKGYTVYQTNRDDAFMPLVKYDWNYVAIQDTFLFSDVIRYYPIVTSYLERVAGNGKISFYKRSSRIEKKSLKQFLNIPADKILYNKLVTFDADVPDNHISGAENVMITKDHASSFARLDSNLEFGATIIVNSTELKNETNLKTVVSFDFIESRDFGKIQLVASITNKKEIVFYQSYLLSDYYKIAPAWQSSTYQFILPVFKTAGDELKIYLWNPDKKTFYYDNLEVTVYK